MFDALPHPAWTVDTGGSVTFVNAALLRLTGRTSGALLGGGLLEAVHEEDRALFRSHLCGQSSGVTVRVERAGGGWQALRAEAQPLTGNGAVVGQVGLGVPVTAGLTGAGPRDEAYFRQLAEAHPAGVVLGRADGTRPYVNGAFLRLIRVSREAFEAGAVDWQALTPPEWLSADERAVAQALERGHSEPYEKEYLLPGGTRLPVLVGLARSGHEDGTLVAYVLDLSDRRAAETRWAGLRAELEARVAERTAQLGAERERAEVLAGLGEALQRATSAEDVAALALDRLGPALRAGSMLIVRLHGERIEVLTFWGDLPEPILTYMTRPDLRLTDTPMMQHVARTRGALYLDDYHSLPGAVGTFPRLACAAEPITTPDRSLLGFVVAWRPQGSGRWSEGQRDLMRRAAGTLSLALERAQAAQALEEQTQALDAFTAYTERVGSETDAPSLARHALEVLRLRFPGGSGAYYEPEGGLWKAQVWTPDIPAPLAQEIRGGLPAEHPLAVAARQSREPVFVEGWDPERGGVVHSGDYGAAATYPILLGEEVRGHLALSLRGTREWSTRDRALFRAVGRGLQLALERAEVARQLATRNTELAVRTRALEEERRVLAQRTGALARSNRDLEQFTYVASHDLQEPLRTVTSYAELLQKRYHGQLDARADLYLKTITEGAVRMKSLVQDLLTFSQVRSVEHGRAPVDLHALAGEVLQILRGPLEQLGGEVVLGPLPTVPGDRRQLAQLLQHLLGNALKFHRPGVPPRVTLDAWQERGHWRVTVRDNGIGIEPQYFDRIFRVFQRLHSQGHYGGTGMGLALCQQIVERHGGHLWVESVPGEGSTFHFTLPAGER